MSDGKTLRPPGTWMRPCAATMWGAMPLMSTPSRLTLPCVGVTRPDAVAEHRGLPGAVGAEQRDRLAPAHLEAHAEQHLHLAVRDVDRRRKASATERRSWQLK